MRHLVSIFLIIALAGSATAQDLGGAPKNTKSNSHVGQNPGTPDGRQGGEDLGTAVAIDALPFFDTGNTSDNYDDLDPMCPYGSNSPDVFYRYIPVADECVSVDLCGSSYDTKTYIMDGATNVIACNDDYYMDEECGIYVSYIEEAYLEAGMEYFIGVDGYGGDSGDYILEISVYIPPPPCFLTCDGLPEGEPALGPNYSDAFNGGCNSPEYDNPFADLTQAADADGELIFCGIAGWFDGIRDTDWMYFMIGEAGIIEWTLDAEYPVYGFLLSGTCDDGINVEDQITAGSCLPATMTIEGTPGDIVMLWVGPTEYSPPSGFVGYEFNYVGNFNGLAAGVVSTSNFSFDAVKSMYR